MEWMQSRIQGADCVLCLVSAAYLAAQYSSWELRVAQWAAAGQRRNFVLPVFVQECEPPLALAHIKRCELFNVSEEEARARLARYVAIPDSAAPALFPGKPTSADLSPPPADPVEFPGAGADSTQTEASSATSGPPASPLLSPSPVRIAAMRDERPRSAESQIKDEASLKDWLGRQSREPAIAIAARAALRAAPLAHGFAAKIRWLNPKTSRHLTDFTGAIFRASALARAAAKYPGLAIELSAGASAAHQAASAAHKVAEAEAVDARFDQPRGNVLLGGSHAVFAAACAAATVAGAGPSPAADATAYAAFAPWQAALGEPAIANAAHSDVWNETSADVSFLGQRDPSTLVDLPLWSRYPPGWATDGWTKLRASLPKSEGWQIWIDWYLERLRGESRAEPYELAFVTVPLNVWEDGPSAANRWIRNHLP
jgi:hypothetical protein